MRFHFSTNDSNAAEIAEQNVRREQLRRVMQALQQQLEAERLNRLQAAIQRLQQNSAAPTPNNTP
jgi:hypothetical protein